MEANTTKREVVIEYERIQVIRKRAKTDLAECPGCGHTSDHVRLEIAIELFETTADGIREFVERNNCHQHAATTGTLLCLDSLLEVMKTRRLRRRNQRIGEQK